MVNKVMGYRKMLCMTQKQMAEELGISEGQYRAKEKGKYEFSQNEMKTFQKLLISKVGNIKLESIFF